VAVDLTTIQKGGSKRPPIMLLYGSSGIGKSSFAASAPNPIFIRTEDGLGALEVDTFPEATNLQDVTDALAALYEPNEYKTVVIDSLSQLEPMILERVAQDHGKSSPADLGYGKEFLFALDYWREIIAACKGLANQGKNIVLIAHAEVVTFQSPETDPYDRFQPRLHKRAFAYVAEQSDIVAFASYPVHVRKGSDDKKGRGIATGERQLALVERPSMVAKNRYSMPETVSLLWDAVAEHLPNNNAKGAEA
jgi:hypothetical protein